VGCQLASVTRPHFSLACLQIPEVKWELNEKDTVELKIGWTGRKKLFLNGELIEKFSRRKAKPFEISDGRSVEIVSAPGAATAVELRAAGELALPTPKGQTLKCEKCEAIVKPYDKFCDSCGEALPSVEGQVAATTVQTASNGIGALAILFVISGFIMAALQYNKAQDALKNLAQFDASAQWSVPVEGKIVTVGELRELVMWEPKAVLLVNLVLAAIMTGLYFWGKRSPLPAILVAAGTYLAVIVLSAIADPASLGQGLIMKFIIVAMLYRGIKAGFQQRALRG